ncbi:MAG: hypothetical protein JXA33_19680 [Anaerolineae bacterium]|nr:hypothetical protein [Anaerolineae bacterium]
MNDTLSPLQQQLREAMSGWGCPLCRLAAQAEKTYIDSVNYERVIDVKTRDVLKASRGFCAHHSRMWEDLNGSALGVAIVYHISILDLLRDTEPEKLPKGGGLFRRGEAAAQVADILEASVPCPACTLVEETAHRFATILLKDLKDPTLQTLLRDCGGLCLPHLRMALRTPGAGKVHSTLIAVHREAWQNLMGEMEEFIRKNDHRFRHEPLTDKEGDSWIRALDVMTGKRG